MELVEASISDTFDAVSQHSHFYNVYIAQCLLDYHARLFGWWNLAVPQVPRLWISVECNC